jgi:predicted pyridoxine 5'-phosphate oxidase superfamily flavin-nucleotide-binding protein
MSRHYGQIAFTDTVKDVQQRYGSRPFYERHQARTRGAKGPDPMTPDVRDFLAERDSFYLATVSETGWPYVQFRGGPPGFLRVLDENTLGWADFRGNLQYISTGNLGSDDRVALFVMDYPHRRRLKIFGHARVVFAEDDPEMIGTLTRPGDDGVVERGVLVTVEAFDWNCPQHITPRYSLAELEPHIGALRDRVAALTAENAELRKSCQPVDD